MKYITVFLLLLLTNCHKKENQHLIKPQNMPRENIALLVDNSLTMLAPDFEPNRIITMKEVIGNLIKKKKENQAFSIVVFAGNSFLLCPLTKDKNQLLSAVDKLDRGIMKMRPGANFSNALFNGIASLKSQSGNKTMILFTDGKENLKSHPHQIAVDDAAGKNIKIDAVVITAKDSVMMPATMDLNGNIQFAKVKAEPIDRILIGKITSETGGGFKVFYTKKELLKFDISQFISEKPGAKSKPEKNKMKSNGNQLSKIYKEIQSTNDSLKVRFEK